MTSVRIVSRRVSCGHEVSCGHKVSWNQKVKGSSLVIWGREVTLSPMSSTV